MFIFLNLNIENLWKNGYCNDFCKQSDTANVKCSIYDTFSCMQLDIV